MNNFKSQFPIYTTYKDLVYLDSAATTQKPDVVINSIVEHYERSNSNIHRGLYKIAHSADTKWLEAHKKVAEYINANTYKEVFFLKNATEGLNWIANTIDFGSEDIIIVSQMEHHSNLLPWLKICEDKGCKLIKVRISDDGVIDTTHLKELLQIHGRSVKVVSVTHQSNVLGTINPVKSIVNLAKEVGAITVLDCAQSIAHTKVDVQEIGCDVLVFSSHKVYGPTGVGVVYCREELLNNISPWLRGGEMVKNVKNDSVEYSDLPWRFEAGTPAIEAGVGLGRAVEWFSNSVDSLGGWDEYEKKEMELTQYLENSLKRIDGLKLVGGDIDRRGVVAFTIDSIHPHDVASLLAEYNVCVRAGYHCAQPLHDTLGIKTSVRASIGIYNDIADIDRLAKELSTVVNMFKV